MAINDFTIECTWKVIDGWFDNGMEYALVEVKVGECSPDLHLFWCPC